MQLQTNIFVHDLCICCYVYNTISLCVCIVPKQLLGHSNTCFKLKGHVIRPLEVRTKSTRKVLFSQIMEATYLYGIFV